MANRPGVRARFTLWYGCALIVTVLFVSGGIYFFVKQALMGQVESHLRKDVATINEYVKNDPGNLAKVAAHGPILLFRVSDALQSIVISENWNREGLEMTIPASIKSGELLSFQVANGKRYRALSSSTEQRKHTYQIVVAHEEESVHQSLNSLAIIIMLILPLAIAISLVIGYFIAGRVLEPIRVITGKASGIGAENLSERLPVGDGDDDEFSRLAVVFNQTFARLEDSFTRLRRFTADAAHELRTPLAAIRSIGETALHAPEDQVNSREVIGSILEESDRLRHLVDALLILSRADSGDIRLHQETVDLSDITMETVDLLNVLAEEKRQTITLTSSGKVMVQIDPTTVRQALTNILDNAIKYAPAESTIYVTVGTRSAREVFVEIKDCGCGIPDEEIGRIFDRFYRVDKGRSREYGGAGLGLSISKWAVENNGGWIEVESTINQGSLFRVVFIG